MHSIFHILLTLWREKVALFWPIWTTMTVLAALFTAWLVGRAAASPLSLNRMAPGNSTTMPGSVWTKSSWLAVGLFVLFVAGYIALIFVWEDFAYYDNSQFTLFSLQGHSYPPPIWVGNGRFFPLDMQEFNLISHFSKSIFAYHALPVIELLIVCSILLLLDQELGMKARVGLAACILLAPGMVVSFGGLVYPERNVVFWMLCLACVLKWFDRTQSTAAAVAAVVSAQFMLYYKEMAFLFVWGLVAARLLLRCRNSEQPGWNLGKLREKASCLDLCLGALGLAFLCYYGAVMFRHSNFQYAQQARIPELSDLLDYLKTDLLAWLFAAILIGRTCLIWKRQTVPWLLWDGLAFGALGYFAGFLVLGMFSDYYLTPVDVIAVLYVGRCIFPSWRKRALRSKILVVIVMGAVLVQNLLLSAFREFHRKNLIHANAEIASVVKARYQHDAKATRRLFFPFADRYVITEFGAYLSYRGLPIEGASDDSSETNGVVLVSRAMAKDGPLVDYRSIIGRAGRKPELGDLIIILPDNDASRRKIEAFLRGGRTIFSYTPSPQFPGWLWSLIRELHFIFPELRQNSIPDDWMHASVTVWRGNK